MAVTIIIKGDRGGYTAPRQSTQSYEQKLYDKIDKGAVTDSDISYIQEHGDYFLRRKLDEKHNKEWKVKKHLDNVYGTGVFDGKDNDGNLYKDTSLFNHKEMPEYNPLNTPHGVKKPRRNSK